MIYLERENKIIYTNTARERERVYLLTIANGLCVDVFPSFGILFKYSIYY